MPRKKRDAWVAELAAARQKYDKMIHDQYELALKYSHDTEHLHPAVIGKEVHDFLYKGDIDPKQTVTGLGGWNRELQWSMAAGFRPTGRRLRISVRSNRARPRNGDWRKRGGAARRRASGPLQGCARAVCDE
jgi:hypothetical protein